MTTPEAPPKRGAKRGKSAPATHLGADRSADKPAARPAKPSTRRTRPPAPAGHIKRFVAPVTKTDQRPLDGDLYLAGPSYVDALMAELGVKGPTPSDGLLVVPSSKLAPVDAVFARQVMPQAKYLRGAGPNDLAAAVLDRLDDNVSITSKDIEVTTPELARKGSSALDEHPLTAAAMQLLDVLQKKTDGRRAKHGGAEPSRHLVRVLLADAWGAWVSVQRVQTGLSMLTWPTVFPAGRALDEGGRNAPSSAHRKLTEALSYLQVGPGPDDVVLDLGAAPGGWSHVALSTGARVIAVDRAALDSDIANHPRLTHVRADAFSYVPEQQPTWLLCDVIAEPERALQLARTATTSRVLVGCVVTLKLTRPVDVAFLNKARAVARGTPGWFGRCKQLVANKMEVTLMMRRAAAAQTAG